MWSNHARHQTLRCMHVCIHMALNKPPFQGSEGTQPSLFVTQGKQGLPSFLNVWHGSLCALFRLTQAGGAKASSTLAISIKNEREHVNCRYHACVSLPIQRSIDRRLSSAHPTQDLNPWCIWDKTRLLCRPIHADGTPKTSKQLVTTAWWLNCKP